VVNHKINDNGTNCGITTSCRVDEKSYSCEQNHQHSNIILIAIMIMQILTQVGYPYQSPEKFYLRSTL